MDTIPLPPPQPTVTEAPQAIEANPESKSPPPVSSQPEKVPVLGKEKAKKRLLAFGKGISFGLKPRNAVLQGIPRDDDDEDDEEMASSMPIGSNAYSTLSSSFTSVTTTSTPTPTKKMNIDAIMEEEKELAAAASRPLLAPYGLPLAASHVNPAVPQLIVPLLPPSALLPPVQTLGGTPSTAALPSPSPRKLEERKSTSKKRRSINNKYADIQDIPSSWKAFKAHGLLVADPDFPKFKRVLDKENGRFESIEARKRSDLNIVKSGDEFNWREYLGTDPVASQSELAFRGLTDKTIQGLKMDAMEDLLWNLASDYHSKEFPKNVNKRLKTRHGSISYCYHPRFYPKTYKGREEVFSGEDSKVLSDLLETLFKQKKEEEVVPNSKFKSGSFVSREGPSPIEYRQWFRRTEHFLNDKETVFTEVVKAREVEGFVPSVGLSWNAQWILAGGPHCRDEAKENVDIQEAGRKRAIDETLNEDQLEEEPVFPSKKPKHKKQKKTRKNEEDEREVDSESDTGAKKAKKKKKHKKQKKLKKAKKKKYKKSSVTAPEDEKDDNEENKNSDNDHAMNDEEDGNEVVSLKKKKKHSKKPKKSKQQKHSPFPEAEGTSNNVTNWEEDPQSPSPPPTTSSSSSMISVKDPRTRSLFAVAGYGIEDHSRRRNNSGGPRTPSPRSRGPRTPSPFSKWRPPSPPSRKQRRRSRSKSYDSNSRNSHHSRSPSHHRRRKRSYHYRSPSPPHLERSVADSTISDADLPGYAAANLRQIAFEDFPQRLSLDERLEKELGIHVQPPPPGLPQDFSVPPPGYPHYHPPPSFDIPPPPIPSQFITLPTKDNPEEGRLVRVGNMLQIVPEGPRELPMVPPPALNDKVAAAVAAVNAALQVNTSTAPKADTAHTAVTLMRKMEEMKRQRDREREARKEEQDTPILEETPKAAAEEEQLDKVPQKEEQPLEEEEEAKILQEAISSVPEMDDEEYFSNSPGSSKEALKASSSSSSSSNTSKLKKHQRIHYISLKPFSKKERNKRGAKGFSMGGRSGSSLSNEEEDEDESEWVPRSPVPLPDASTCKPILMQLGFSGREKKVLRYADGILPGQGSPDINGMESSLNTSSSTEAQPSSQKKRKKIRLKVLSRKDPSPSESSSPPPPPPSGSPLLQHYSTWLSKKESLSN